MTCVFSARPVSPFPFLNSSSITVLQSRSVAKASTFVRLPFFVIPAGTSFHLFFSAVTGRV